MFRFFRRTPLTPENAGRMLALHRNMAEREFIKARARQLCAELGRDVPEAMK